MTLVKDRKCMGYLKEDSPINDLFPDGEVPLKSPIIQKGKGREEEPVELYEVNMAALDDEQIIRIMIAMQKLLGHKLDQQAFFEEGWRLKTEHFVTVVFDPRLIS